MIYFEKEFEKLESTRTVPVWISVATAVGKPIYQECKFFFISQKNYESMKLWKFIYNILHIPFCLIWIKLSIIVNLNSFIK